MDCKGIIIAARGKHDTGKTTAVNHVLSWLVQNGAAVLKKDVIEYDGGKTDDFSAVLEYQGIRIGISSMGDPGVEQEKILNGFIADGCRVILCACRTKGATKEPIVALRKCWDVYFIVPEDDGFIPKDELLVTVQKAVQSVKDRSMRTSPRIVWKVGCRWDEDGSPEANIAQDFERYNVAFVYTEAFFNAQPGDLVVIGDGEKIIAIGIILSPVKRIDKLDIAMTEEEKKRFNYGDDNCCGSIVRYHWFKDYSLLKDESLKKRMEEFIYQRRGRFCQVHSIEDETNRMFIELEKLKGLMD